MSAPRLSVLMITGNVIAGAPGRAIFERVLQSVAFADELVLVDSESTDGTREMAARYGARIFIEPYRHSLKHQKEVGLPHITGDWVLWVDADEVLPPALADEIRATIRDPQFDAYRIRRDHVFVGQVLQHDGEDVHLRLWRRGVGGFYKFEHNDEYYEVPGPVGTLAIPMEHHSTATLNTRLVKMPYFAASCAAQLPLPTQGPYSRTLVWRKILRPAVQRFYGVYWVQRGYRDGVRGLIWAALCAQFEFYKYILLWERAQQPPAAHAATADTNPPAPAS